MLKENEKQRILTRRAMIFGGIQVAAFATLAGRLAYLQFIKAEEYATMSENNRIKLLLIAPERGNILDRHGLPMASNEKNFRLFLDYSALSQQAFGETLERVNGLVPIHEKRLAQLANAKVTRASMPEMLKEHLSWEEVSLIELNMLDLPGVYIDPGHVRYYPMSDKASHLIGHVGSVTEGEQNAEDQPLLKLPDFKIGKNGMEKMLEDRLRGQAGIRQLEVNVKGVPVREIGMQKSVSGEEIRLTIDARLQEFASTLVEKESASVVVMNVRNGDVLAMVSMPGFDPNAFSKGILSDYWKELNQNKKNPLMNKAISGQYPPGSTFKMLVGLAGLEKKIVTPSSSIFCPGHFFLGDHRFNCWKEGGHGSVNYHEAVAQSCDTYFYTIAQRMGIQSFANMARHLGLGQDFDLGIVGEKSGIIPDPDWKKKRYKQEWNPGDTINAAIGQGYVLATPLQLCVMTARMVNGGYAVRPRLLTSEGTENTNFPLLDIKQEYLKHAVDGMIAVVNSNDGTAYGKRIMEPRFAMGGKTGTSQVRKILVRGMKQDLLPWEHRHHALFVGFAPIDEPKYAVCVAVEHGGGGSAVAAPIARDVLLKIQQLEEEDGAKIS